jgi:pimeloyl-ACP methyl ester carboxylesterase
MIQVDDPRLRAQMAAASSSAAPDSPAQTKAAASIQRHAVKIGNETMSWLESGSGAPLVLLHGIGSWAESWRPVLPLLSDRFRVIAWDMPGYGGSDPLTVQRPAAGPYASALAGLLRKLDIAEAHVLGHSLGALVGADFAAAYPNKIRSLVLASPAGGYGVGRDGQMPDGVRQRVDELRQLGAAGFAKKRAANLCAREPRQDCLQAVEDAMAQVRMPGYGQACWLLSQGDLVSALQKVTTPGLVIGAEQDRVVPCEKSRVIADHWSGARYAEISGVGHAGYVEKPTDYVAPLRAFLEEIN